MRDSVAKLVTRRGVGNPCRDAEHPVQKQPPALGLAEVEAAGRLIEQVLQIRPRAAQSFTVAVASVPADEGIRILALVQDDHVDVKAFSYKQFTRSRRCALTGRVGVEAEDRLRREPPQQLRLLRRQRRAARGHGRSRLRLVDLREIEIPLY